MQSIKNKQNKLQFNIEGKHYVVQKTVLKQQMKSAQNNQLEKKNSIDLPIWVEKQQFNIIYEYLTYISQLTNIQPQKRDQKIFQFFNKEVIKNPKINHTKKLIHLMRISDYLTLEKFQQYFIQKCIIDSLNNQNCILYLQETHKKLKNTSSGTAQAWYNLLNACIDYISHHLCQLYLSQPERIQKLHQKILSQILDRKIKYQTLPINQNNSHTGSLFSQQNSRQKQIIFNLLMKSKKANSVDALCACLKNNLLNKKINKKMHAKLSWKLHDLNQIIDKKVKNFKFLDLNWTLEAKRIKQQNNQGLQIKLTLLPTSTEDNQANLIHYSIGVFYSKLFWSIQSPSLANSGLTSNSNIQQKEGQKPLQIHYISMKNPLSIEIFQISPEFEQKLQHKKLELSIYCSIDHCYSFVINYIIIGYNKLKLDEKKISKEQIYALIQGSKCLGKYSQAVWLIKYLKNNQLQIPLYLLQNIQYDKLPTYETEFLKKLVRNQNPILQQVFGKKSVNSRALQIENELNSLSNSKVSENFQTKSNKSRNASKGRHRKIFEQSPLKSGTANQSSALTIQNNILSQNPEKNREIQEVLRISNLKNYFFDKNSPYLNLL